MFAFLALAMQANIVLAQADYDDGGEEEKKSYVIVYLVIICCVGLALTMICRTGGKPRTIDFHQEEYE